MSSMAGGDRAIIDGARRGGWISAAIENGRQLENSMFPERI